MEDLQDRGKRGPTLSIVKAVLLKCWILSCCRVSSRCTSSRKRRTWEALVSGGTKRSPSWRRSERLRLKTAFRRRLSSSFSAPSEASRLSQKAPPMTKEASEHWKAPVQLPSRTSLDASTASERSNCPKFKSTPLGVGRIVKPAGPAATRRPIVETPDTEGAKRAAIRVGAGAATMAGTPGTATTPGGAGTPGTPSCTPP
mmetsp:Transcript_106270/g.216696  ORF Transcript_106270/g.216696 Transcript_106270/m.216696 type:complete len:200 (+) Transcript_106270:750-1349(+)